MVFVILIGQFTQAVVSLYWVYCWKIIQQRMLVIHNFHVKIRYIYTHFFSYVFKSCIGFVLSNCVNAKNVYMFSYVFQKYYLFRAIKLFICQKKKKYIWNAKYSIQHRIDRSQTTKCIQYNIHDTKSCELPKYLRRKFPKLMIERAYSLRL